MIISCEICATKYNINQDFLGQNGRKVKCTQCNHIWHAKSETESVTKDDKIILKEPENILPVTIIKPIPLWMKMIPYPLIILILSIYIIFYSYNVINLLPITEPLYKYFGIYNSKNLKLENITLSKINKANDNYDIKIEGKIVNHSETKSTLPSLKLSVLNSNKENIISNLSKSDNSTMEPGEEFIIDNQITNLDNRAKFIAIDIGNRVELMIR